MEKYSAIKPENTIGPIPQTKQQKKLPTYYPRVRGPENKSMVRLLISSHQTISLVI